MYWKNESVIYTCCYRKVLANLSILLRIQDAFEIFMTLGDTASAYIIFYQQHLSNFAQGLIDICRVLKKNELYVKINYNFKFFKQVWYFIENDNDLKTLILFCTTCIHTCVNCFFIFVESSWCAICTTSNLTE